MKVFLCYRRSDARHGAERIYRHLADRFGSENVFKDVDSVPLGKDYRTVIASAVVECDVLLAIIGKNWLSAVTDDGRRRIAESDDFVRMEIVTALSRDIPVVPVLIDDATQPTPAELPVDIQQFAYRQSAVVRADPDFERDAQRLIHALDRMRTTPAPVKSGTPKLRYYSYVSRAKVEQLFEQLHQPVPDTRSQNSFRPLLSHFFEPGSYSHELTGFPIRKLDAVLAHINQNEKVLDLAELCRQKAGMQLDAFCYAYQGSFYSLGTIERRSWGGGAGGINISGRALERSKDDIVLSKSLLVEPAKAENSIQEIGPNRSNLVSNMCILCSEIEEFTLRLACSYKFFSDMGWSYHQDDGESDVHPHSGNYHFFQGDTDAWFETLVFINGIRKNTIQGTPLYLAIGSDPNMVL
jgi:hypothetical protein